METEPKKIVEQPRSQRSIEGQSNFKGSWTNLMCERLRNPDIRKQVIDLLYEIEQGAKKKEEWDEYEAITVSERYVPRTREEVERDFETDLQKIEKDTPISFGTMGPNDSGEIGQEEELKLKEGEKYDKNKEVINLNWIDPQTNKKQTGKELNITESHEKGHILRRYGSAGSGEKRRYSPHLNERFWKAFDFDAIQPDYIDYKNEEKYRNSKRLTLEIKEKHKNEIAEYLKSPPELAERMSQLKNYFGMEGNEQFTKEHLAFAKKYYVEDVGTDNHMTQFFQAITPRKRRRVY